MQKSLVNWLDEYGESHQNLTNIRIHKICVPIIFISIYWMLFAIPVYINIANVVYAAALFFWFKLNKKIGFYFTIIGLILSIGSFFVWRELFSSLRYPFFKYAAILFILGWIGQFVGHKIEGKKPSFMKDIQFLLIGPIWVFYSKSWLSIVKIVLAVFFALAAGIIIIYYSIEFLFKFNVIS